VLGEPVSLRREVVEMIIVLCKDDWDLAFRKGVQHVVQNGRFAAGRERAPAKRPGYRSLRRCYRAAIFLAFSIEDGHASFLSSKFGEQSFFRMPIHAMNLR
jgi:hypothetical protein